MNWRICAAALAGSGVLFGCHHADSPKPSAGGASENASVRIVTIPEVAAFVRDKSATIYDANGTDTRQKYGVIPGAVLLSSHDSYALSELPADKASKLVFYCGGVMCRASDAAASRASGAGYTNVNVLRDGIKGWKDSGQPTDMPRS